MADTAAMLVAYEAEITRLRAALADAQAVGFAAGVEAVAKEIEGDDDNIGRAMSMAICCSGHECGCMGASVRDYLVYNIRALMPPDLTAAAARVLLGDDAAMNTLSDYEHRQWAGWFRHQLEQSSPENIERWKRQADTPFALLSDEEKAVDRRFADAALRAIAGDTP